MPPKKKAPEPVTPSEAAAAEAQSRPDSTVSFAFRGEDFDVPLSVFISPELIFAESAMSHSGGFNARAVGDAIFVVLSTDAQRRRFLALKKDGESIFDMATEFFEAVNNRTGQGNS